MFEKRHPRIVTVNEMLFGITPDRRTIDVVSILRRMQEEYHAKGKKLYMCFPNLEKDFDRVPRKVLEWALRKKEIPDVSVKSVMNLYEGAKTRVSGLWVVRGVQGSRSWECTNDLCRHLFFLQLWEMLSLS